MDTITNLEHMLICTISNIKNREALLLKAKKGIGHCQLIKIKTKKLTKILKLKIMKKSN